MKRSTTWWGAAALVMAALAAGCGDSSDSGSTPPPTPPPPAQVGAAITAAAAVPSNDSATNQTASFTVLQGAGLDPERSVIFVQSEVKEHAELHLLLSMLASKARLERIPTLKE